MKELSIIIPVLNERENIAPLISDLEQALAGIDYEVIFVDDGSDDGTQKENF
jgi:glycosyltransferase involved in cell wall biosynthesis